MKKMAEELITVIDENLEWDDFSGRVKEYKIDKKIQHKLRELIKEKKIFVLNTGDKMKEKKVKEQLKNIYFILDETGSMEMIKDKTINDFNEYLSSVSKDKFLFTLIKFNSNKIEVVYNDKAIKDVPKLKKETYTPEAYTPLYDAIGYGIKTAEKNNVKEVMFVVLTDGQENSSKEYKQKDIFNLIKEKEKKDWGFVYLGVGKDSWLGGKAMGIYLSLGTNTFSQAANIAKHATKAFRAGGMSNSRSCLQSQFKEEMSNAKKR